MLCAGEELGVVELTMAVPLADGSEVLVAVDRGVAKGTAGVNFLVKLTWKKAP